MLPSKHPVPKRVSFLCFNIKFLVMVFRKVGLQSSFEDLKQFRIYAKSLLSKSLPATVSRADDVVQHILSTWTHIFLQPHLILNASNAIANREKVPLVSFL